MESFRNKYVIHEESGHPGRREYSVVGTREDTMAAFRTMAACCGGIVHRGLLGPTHCEAKPTVAGLWYAAHGRTADRG